jgi:uncharacterized surface anchored protein
MRVRLWASVVVYLLVFVPFSSGQKSTGTITGTVTDASGAVVAGASVGLINERTGSTRNTTTNEQGSFSFPELDSGTYTLTLNKAGFKQMRQKNVELHVADVTTLNVKMDVGAVSETVTVDRRRVEHHAWRADS